MRRHVTRYIDHLHTKPEEERIQYAVWGAGMVTGVIFFVWLLFFFAKLNTPTRVVLPPAQSETAQERVDRILEEASFGIAPTQETAETPTETTGGVQEAASADLRKLFPEVE